MLLDLRLLYEAPVVTRYIAPAGKVSRKRIAFVPVLVRPAEAILEGIDLYLSSGKLAASGSAKNFLPTIRSETGATSPLPKAGAMIRLIGSEVNVRSDHKRKFSSVVLGSDPEILPDDQEALTALFLSQ